MSAEHARLRVLMADVVREALQTARKVGHHVVRERLALLRAAAERAIDVEESELVPLLQARGPAGDARVELLRERHARLLAALEDFEDDVATGHHHADLVARAEELVGAFAGELEDVDAGEEGRPPR